MFGIGDIDLVKEKLNETAKICIEMIYIIKDNENS